MLARLRFDKDEMGRFGTIDGVRNDATEAMKGCRLCPRACGADRLNGRAGYCGAGLLPRVFRHGPHFGEEPPLTGTRGSGAVFFSHCTLRCVYCQNYPWSQLAQGEDLENDRLTAIFRGLAEQSCHNWNLVSPTPWLPQIAAALAPLIRDGIRLPIVYNSSGFESAETLAAYQDLIDIALVDLRYAEAATAKTASDASAYVAAARETVRWFWNRLGPLHTDDRDVATRGVICRVLVLPGHADEAVANLAWLAETAGTQVHVSVMSQYTPVHNAARLPGWDRRVSAEEYARVTEAVGTLGFENGWVQEYDEAAATDLLGCEMPAGAAAVGRRTDATAS